MANSRGNAISAYIPAFARGAFVYGANIQSGVVTSAHLADGTVVGGEIGAGAVTSAKIGTGAVVAVKIGAGAATSAKIGNNAVVSGKLGANAVLAASIAAGAVTSAKIGAGAVTNAKMKAAFLSGTISGLTAFTPIAVAHGLGVAPKFVVATMLPTAGEVSAKHTICVAAASGATSTNIYLVSSKSGNVKYVAYVQV